MDMPWPTIFLFGSAFVGSLTGFAVGGWWLATKFNHVYERIANVKEVISTKLGEHEKLDTARFENQTLAIMRVELLMQSAGLNPHGIPVKPQ